jgi:lysozyme
MMTYSKTGESLTESFESCRLMAYYDLKGVLTIGWGHTGHNVIPGLQVTQAQADSLLMDDIESASNCVNACVVAQLTQPEFDAIVDLVYNIGCKSFGDSTMRRLLNQGDYAGAAEQFDAWDHAGGKVVAGLLRRREAETQEFDDGA